MLRGQQAAADTALIGERKAAIEPLDEMYADPHRDPARDLPMVTESGERLLDANSENLLAYDTSMHRLMLAHIRTALEDLAAVRRGAEA